MSPMENRSEPVSSTAMHCSEVSSIKDLQPYGFWFECTSTSWMQSLNSCKLASDELFQAIILPLLLSTKPTGCVDGSTNYEHTRDHQFKKRVSEPSLCLSNPCTFSQATADRLGSWCLTKEKEQTIRWLFGGWVDGLVDWLGWWVIISASIHLH